MGGIAGFLDITSDTPDRAGTARDMADALAHRGPDDGHVWVDDGAGIALGFRRLAVQDLTARGRQPMQSQDGRWVAMLDGAVFNHQELRSRLAPFDWRGHSDAEIMVEAVARWGIARTLNACEGMFALALWDRLEQTLHLARDRLGEKPLYWGLCGGAFLFGSELKALKRHPAFDDDIDREALSAYLALGWVASPQSIYRHARKLPPGSLMTIKGATRTIRPYWSAKDRARAAAGSFTGGRAATAERLNQLLRASVSLRMQADVPVGVLLSGGIEDSLIAAIMTDLASGPVHSFTLALERAEDDPSRHAHAAARHLGTTHTEIRVTDADALALVPRLPVLWDEPFADSGQIFHCLLAEAARRQVTVALSGDGAGAVFGSHGAPPSQPPPNPPRPAVRPHWTRGLRRSLDTLTGRHARSTGPAAPPMAQDRLARISDSLCVRTDRAAMAHSLETRLPFLDHAVAEFAWGLPEAAPSKAMLCDVLHNYMPCPQGENCSPQGAAWPMARLLAGPLKGWADDLLSESRLKQQGLVDAQAVARCWRDHRAGRNDRQAELWPVLMFQAWLEHRRP